VAGLEKIERTPPPSGREFLIARQNFSNYDFSNVLKKSGKKIILDDHQKVRQFVAVINQDKPQSKQWAAAPVNIISLINEIFVFILNQFLTRKNISGEAVVSFVGNLENKDDVMTVLEAFLEHYPPYAVRSGKYLAKEYLATEAGLTTAIEECIVLKLTLLNKACEPYRELFENRDFERLHHTLDRMVDNIERMFADTLDNSDVPEQKNLIDMLKKPARLYPESLYKQLQYIYDMWRNFLPDVYTQRLLSAVGFVKDEELFFARKERGGGRAEAVPLKFSDYSGAGDSVTYVKDKEWMPHVIVMSKNVLVWLSQLSRRYGRAITALDQIPDEELSFLADSGFNALWLVGVWQRSDASKKMKRLMGSNDVEASAYSLDSYDIARSIGGWPAFKRLRDKAAGYGIRLAGDMVPNHTGMDSEWMDEHPEYFMTLKELPFPGYSFNGENLSGKPHLGIYIEDHYYNKSDASVIFKRVDLRNGDTTYVYHGNDGTSIPWNDTAQLNYLNPKTREAVIQKILDVARSFPIIRFDAAMVLVKKEIERLWYPLPGDASEVASRSDFALTKEEFDKAIPREFWQEVVERVSNEVPETLLFAEAFWMLENYFVHNLGLHRVYNSAFMHMMMDEENAKYRESIRNTLNFNGHILKRYVNYLSNPDEKSTAEQFGKGDKYFGVCTLMITLPGMPLFAHGQVEGLTERYGMEYNHAYFDESVDAEVVARHQREIFPLMRRRELFSGCTNFRLYGFVTDKGVNENVFAYSNSVGLQRVIVLFNNSAAPTGGFIKTSETYTFMEKGDERLRTQNIGDALFLHKHSSYYMTAYEQRSGLWYIYRSVDILQNGFIALLNGYEHQVFWEISEYYDYDGILGELFNEHAGKGFDDFPGQLKERRLRNIHEALHYFVGAKHNIIQESLHSFYNLSDKETEIYAAIRENIENSCDFLRFSGNDEELISSISALYGAFIRLGAEAARHSYWHNFFAENYSLSAFLASWITARSLLMARERDIKANDRAEILFDDWLLSQRFERQWETGGWGDYRLYDKILRAFINSPFLYTEDLHTDAYSLAERLFVADAIADACGINQFEGILWFDAEKTARLLNALMIIMLYETYLRDGETLFKAKNSSFLEDIYKELMAAYKQSGYQMKTFFKILGDQ
jgi:glycosidase